MKFYFEKIQMFKNKANISTNALSKAMGVHRATVWSWENGKKIPSELKIRKLADILNVSVNEISDLKPAYVKSEIDLSEVIDPWIQFADENSKDLFSKFNKYMFMIQEQHKKLQRSTIISRALLSSIESILYIKDINNNYITANSAFRELLSLKSDYDVVGKSDFDFFSTIEAKINHEQDKQVLQTGEAIRNVENYILGSRKKKIGLISKIPILDSKNKMVGLIVNIIDITERVKASKDRKLLEKAINNIEDCIWIAKVSEKNISKMDLLFINKAVEKITAFNREDFYRNPLLWENFIQKKYHKQRIKNRQSNNYPIVSEYKANNAADSNNSEITIREKIFYDKTENIYLGIIEDTTNIRKNKEIRILLEKVLSESHDIVWIREYPPSNKLLYVSKSVHDMYGYSSEIFYKDSDFWYNNCVHPDDKAELLNNRDSSSWLQRKTHRIISKSGNIRWLETSILKTKFFDSKCVAYIERDVTERIKTNECIVNTTKLQMAKALQAKGVSKETILEVSGLMPDEIQ